MKGKIFKKTAAAVMAVALVGGALPTAIGANLFAAPTIGEMGRTMIYNRLYII